MGAHLGSREAPLSGTGSNLMFFFPYTRYILEATEQVAWRGHQGTNLPLTLSPQSFQVASRSVLPNHTPLTW